MTEFLEEINLLKDLLQKEKKYRIEVEEERDFLLDDNLRLRTELELYKQESEFTLKTTASSTSQPKSVAKAVSSVVTVEKSYANEMKSKVSDACGGKNVVCTAFVAYKNIKEADSSHAESYTGSVSDVWLCGGVDAHVSGYDSRTKELLFSVALSAPVLSIDVHGANIACGMMDGSHTILKVYSNKGIVSASTAIEHSDDSPDATNTCTDKASEAKVVRKHTKYVVLVKWSPDGRFLVTVSHDQQVILYRRCPRTDCMGEFKIFLCASTPESACFVPSRSSPSPEAELAAANEVIAGGSGKTNTFGSEASTIGEFYFLGAAQRDKPSAAAAETNKVSKICVTEGSFRGAGIAQSVSNLSLDGLAESVKDGNGDQAGSMKDYLVPEGGDAGVDTWAEDDEYDLVLGMRDTAHLTYINCTTFASREVSLNENSWDLHVSFIPLYLAPSPCGGRLLVATDKHMHIVLRTGTNTRLQVLSGHSCGDYGKPVVQWDWRGEYVFCNTDNDNVIYVYSMMMGKVVQKLAGHGKGLIRGLCAHSSKSELLTVSYDKSMVFWSI